MKYNILYLQEQETELTGGAGQGGVQNADSQGDDMKRAVSAIEKTAYIHKGGIGVAISDEEYNAFNKMAETNDELKKFKQYVDESYKVSKKIKEDSNFYYLDDPEYRRAIKGEMDRSFFVNNPLIKEMRERNPNIKIGDESTIAFYESYGNEIVKNGMEIIQGFSDLDLGITDFSLIDQSANMLSSEPSAAALAEEVYLGGSFAEESSKNKIVSRLEEEGFERGTDFDIEGDKLVILMPKHDDRRGNIFEAIYDEFGEDAVLWSLDGDDFDDNIFYVNDNYKMLGKPSGYLPNGLAHYEGKVVLGLADEGSVAYRGYGENREQAWRKNYLSGADIRFDQSKEKDVFSHWWRSMIKAFDEGTDLLTNFVLAERVSSYMEGRSKKDVSYIDTYGYLNYINNIETSFFQTEKELNKHPLSLYSIHGVMGDFTGQMLPELPLMLLTAGTSRAVTGTAKGILRGVSRMWIRRALASSKVAFRGVKATKSIGQLARLGNMARNAGYTMLRGGASMAKAGVKKSLETVTNLGILHGAAYAASSAYSEARRMGLGIDVATDVGLLAGGAVLGSEAVLGSMATNFTRRLMGGFSSYEEKMFDAEFSKAMKTWVGDIISSPGKVSAKSGSKLVDLLQSSMGKIQSWSDNTFWGGTISNAVSESGQETFEEIINLYGKEIIEEEYGLSDETFVFDTSDLFTHVTMSIFFGSLPMGALMSGIVNLRKNMNGNYRLSRDSNTSLDSFIVSSILNGKTDLLLSSIEKMKKDKVFGTYTKGRALPKDFKGDVNDFYTDVLKQQVALYSAIIKQEKKNIERNEEYLDALFDKTISKVKEVAKHTTELALEERMKALDEAAMPLAKSLKQAVKDKDVSRMALLTAALEHEHRAFTELSVANGVMMMYNRHRPAEQHQAVVEHVYKHGNKNYVFNPINKRWETYNPERHVLLADFDYKKAMNEIDVPTLNAFDRVMFDSIKDTLNALDEIKEQVLISEISSVIDVGRFYAEGGGMEIADIEYLSSVYGRDNVAKALDRIIETLSGNEEYFNSDDAMKLTDMLNELRSERVTAGKLSKVMSSLIELLDNKLEENPDLGRRFRHLMKRVGLLEQNTYSKAMNLSRELEKKGDTYGKVDDFYSFIFHSLSSLSAVSAISPFTSANYMRKMTMISSLDKKFYYSKALADSFYHDPSAVSERVSKVAKKDKKVKEDLKKESDKLSEKTKKAEETLEKMKEVVSNTEDTSKKVEEESSEEGGAKEEAKKDEGKTSEEVKGEIQETAKKLLQTKEPEPDKQEGKTEEQKSTQQDSEEKGIEEDKKEVEKKIDATAKQAKETAQKLSDILNKVKEAESQARQERKDNIINDIANSDNIESLASALYKAEVMLDSNELTEEEKQIIEQGKDKLWEAGFTMGSVPVFANDLSNYEVVEEVNNPELASMIAKDSAVIVAVDIPPLMSQGRIHSKAKVRIVRGTGNNTLDGVVDVVNSLRKGAPDSIIRSKMESIEMERRLKELQSELSELEAKKKDLIEKEKALNSYKEAVNKLDEISSNLKTSFYDVEMTAFEALGHMLTLDDEWASAFLEFVFGEERLNELDFIKNKWRKFIEGNPNASFYDFYSNMVNEFKNRELFYTFQGVVTRLSDSIIHGKRIDEIISTIKRGGLDNTVKALIKNKSNWDDVSKQKVGVLLRQLLFGKDGFIYDALNPLSYFTNRLPGIEGLTVQEYDLLYDVGVALIKDLTSSVKGQELKKSFDQLRSVEAAIRHSIDNPDSSLNKLKREEEELLSKIQEQENKVFELSKSSEGWDLKRKLQWLGTVNVRHLDMLMKQSESILSEVELLIERIDATLDPDVRAALMGRLDLLMQKASNISDQIDKMQESKLDALLSDEVIDEAQQDIEEILSSVEELQATYDRYYAVVNARKKEEARIEQLKKEQRELEARGLGLIKLIGKGSEDERILNSLMENVIQFIDNYIEAANNVDGVFNIDLSFHPLFSELKIFKEILSSYDSDEARALYESLSSVINGLKKAFALVYSANERSSEYLKSEELMSILSGLEVLKEKMEIASEYFGEQGGGIASNAKISIKRLESVLEFERMLLMSELLSAKAEEQQTVADKEIAELLSKKQEVSDKLDRLEQAIEAEMDKIDAVRENVGEDAYRQALESLTPLEQQQTALEEELVTIELLIEEKQKEKEEAKLKVSEDIKTIKERLSVAAEELIGWIKEDEVYPPDTYDMMVSGKLNEALFIFGNAENVYRALAAFKIMDPQLSEGWDYNVSAILGFLEDLDTKWGNEGKRELNYVSGKFALSDEPNSFAESIISALYKKYKAKRLENLDGKIEAIAKGDFVGEPMLDSLSSILNLFKESNAINNIGKVGVFIEDMGRHIKEMIEAFNPPHVSIQTLVNLTTLYQYINKTGGLKEVLGIDMSEHLRKVLNNTKVKEIEYLADFMGKPYEVVLSHFYLSLKDIVSRVAGVTVPVDVFPIDESLIGSISLEEVELAIEALNSLIVSNATSGIDPETLNEISIAYTLREVLVGIKPYLSDEVDIILMASKERSAKIKDFYSEADEGRSTAQLNADDKEATQTNVEMDMLEAVRKGGLTLKDRNGGVKKSAQRNILFSIERHDTSGKENIVVPYGYFKNLLLEYYANRIKERDLKFILTSEQEYMLFALFNSIVRGNIREVDIMQAAAGSGKTSLVLTLFSIYDLHLKKAGEKKKIGILTPFPRLLSKLKSEVKGLGLENIQFEFIDAYWGQYDPNLTVEEALNKAREHYAKIKEQIDSVDLLYIDEMQGVPVDVFSANVKIIATGDVAQTGIHSRLWVKFLVGDKIDLSEHGTLAPISNYALVSDAIKNRRKSEKDSHTKKVFVPRVMSIRYRAGVVPLLRFLDAASITVSTEVSGDGGLYLYLNKVISTMGEREYAATQDGVLGVKIVDTSDKKSYYDEVLSLIRANMEDGKIKKDASFLVYVEDLGALKIALQDHFPSTFIDELYEAGYVYDHNSPLNINGIEVDYVYAQFNKDSTITKEEANTLFSRAKKGVLLGLDDPIGTSSKKAVNNIQVISKRVNEDRLAQIYDVIVDVWADELIDYEEGRYKSSSIVPEPYEEDTNTGGAGDKTVTGEGAPPVSGNVEGEMKEVRNVGENPTKTDEDGDVGEKLDEETVKKISEVITETMKSIDVETDIDRIKEILSNYDTLAIYAALADYLKSSMMRTLDKYSGTVDENILSQQKRSIQEKADKLIEEIKRMCGL